MWSSSYPDNGRLVVWFLTTQIAQVLLLGARSGRTSFVLRIRREQVNCVCALTGWSPI